MGSERRGGPAGTRGARYEVALFNGAELRLANRF